MSLSAAVLEANITTLCTSMPGMPGCSLQKICNGKTDSFCSASSIYSTLCFDMPRMNGCQGYSTCTDCKPTSLPTSRNVTQAIYSICNEMQMDGCSTCSIRSSESMYAECDLLGTYSFLCQQMPEMSQCSLWSQMCSTTPIGEWCAPSTTAPTMKMYFHDGYSDYILFRNWVPKTQGQYAAAVIGCLLLGILYEGLEAGFSHLTVHDYGDFSIKKVGGFYQGWKGFKVAAIAGVSRLISITLAYFLMLLAMTYNVGIFLGVVFGLAIGRFLFSPLAKKPTDCC